MTGVSLKGLKNIRQLLAHARTYIRRKLVFRLNLHYGRRDISWKFSCHVKVQDNCLCLNTEKSGRNDRNERGKNKQTNKFEKDILAK